MWPCVLFYLFCHFFSSDSISSNQFAIGLNFEQYPIGQHRPLQGESKEKQHTSRNNPIFLGYKQRVFAHYLGWDVLKFTPCRITHSYPCRVYSKILLFSMANVVISISNGIHSVSCRLCALRQKKGMRKKKIIKQTRSESKELIFFSNAR